MADPAAIADRLHGRRRGGRVASPADAGPRVALAADPDYPEGLRDLPDPPAAIYVRGSVPSRAAAVAVVGARAASPYGLDRARDLAADLARLGFAIVSGLARGIDAAAHRAALAAGGSTVAVLPGGLDAVSPRHHHDFAEEIAARGALVTEVASGEPAWRGMFLRRNRLIAALGAATVVVEAADRSGSLSTAAAARRIGRPVLAVPGDVDRPTSRGCHALIRAGAGLCEGADDVIRALGPAAAAPGRGPEARVAAALRDSGLPVEALAGAAGLPVADTLAALVRLEWAGLAAALPGQRWRRGAGPR